MCFGLLGGWPLGGFGGTPAKGLGCTGVGLSMQLGAESG